MPLLDRRHKKRLVLQPLAQPIWKLAFLNRLGFEIADLDRLVRSNLLWHQVESGLKKTGQKRRSGLWPVTEQPRCHLEHSLSMPE